MTCNAIRKWCYKRWLDWTVGPRPSDEPWLNRAPIHVTARGERFIFAEDLAKTDQFWKTVKKFKRFAERQGLKQEKGHHRSQR